MQAATRLQICTMQTKFLLLYLISNMSNPITEERSKSDVRFFWCGNFTKLSQCRIKV